MTTDCAVFDVFLILAAARIRISVDATPAMGAPILAMHRQSIGLDLTTRQSPACCKTNELPFQIGSTRPQPATQAQHRHPVHEQPACNPIALDDNVMLDPLLELLTRSLGEDGSCRRPNCWNYVATAETNVRSVRNAEEGH